jgi:hypothetical protein
MNREELNAHLKTVAFNAINREYNNYNTRIQYHWNKRQQQIVIRYVNFEIENLINENNDNFPISDIRRERLERVLSRNLINVIFDDENINEPDNMVELLLLQLPNVTGYGLKKNKKSRRSKGTKKTKKNKRTKKSKK